MLRVDGGAEQYSVSRAELHDVLAAGLADVLHFGKEFVAYQRADDGTVTAQFADGSTATADILIGADGANSCVRRQFLPHAERVDTGIVAIAGKFPLTPESSASLPPTVAIGQHTVIPPRGCGMFVAAHELGDADGGSYVLWAFAAHRGRLSAAVELSELTSAGSPADSVSLPPILTSVPRSTVDHDERHVARRRDPQHDARYSKGSCGCFPHYHR